MSTPKAAVRPRSIRVRKRYHKAVDSLGCHGHVRKSIWITILCTQLMQQQGTSSVLSNSALVTDSIPTQRLADHPFIAKAAPYLEFLPNWIMNRQPQASNLWGFGPLEHGGQMMPTRRHLAVNACNMIIAAHSSRPASPPQYSPPLRSIPF